MRFEQQTREAKADLCHDVFLLRLVLPVQRLAALPTMRVVPAGAGADLEEALLKGPIM